MVRSIEQLSGRFFSCFWWVALDDAIQC
jgi:hypothetical protein